MDLGPGRINNTSLGAANSLMTRRVSSVIGDDKLNFTKALPCAIHSFGFRFNPILFSLSLLLATICASIVTAQQTGQLPKQQFYNTAVFRQYYLADYNDSGNLFNRAYKTAYQRGNRRHLDSVCFLTMMGELPFLPSRNLAASTPASNHDWPQHDRLHECENYLGYFWAQGGNRECSGYIFDVVRTA